MFNINQEKFAEGRAHYERGASIAALSQVLAHEEERPLDENQNERVDWAAREMASKSIILGFAEGLVADIRRIAANTRHNGMRA
jgi:hypothetical protein